MTYTYTIVYETEEAYKIQVDDGFEFWVPKKWWDDGYLTSRGHTVIKNVN